MASPVVASTSTKTRPSVTHLPVWVLPVPGGVLVRDLDGAVIGAVGVTGDSSDNDAEAACAGITAVGYTPEP